MALPLPDLLAALEALAPLALAASWDNVGLLVEPPPGRERPVTRVLLTIDLEEAVLAEALAAEVELVVAYHPPIFRPLTRLTRASAETRVLLGAIAGGIAVYSPHTALDAVPGGVNDWLLEAFGERVREATAIEPAAIEPAAPPAGADGRAAGAGRRARLEPALGLAEAVARVKAHLQLSHVRLAAARAHAGGAACSSVAVCPGAGGSLFAGMGAVDLMLTGEMRHHDVRARNAAGTSVILCDHTNTERGYLPRLARDLDARLGGRVELVVSRADRDPLAVT